MKKLVRDYGEIVLEALRAWQVARGLLASVLVSP
jgi:hypothetical protein